MYYEATGREPDSVEKTLARFAGSMHNLINGSKSRFRDEYVWPWLNYQVQQHVQAKDRTPDQQHTFIAKTMNIFQGLSGGGNG